MFRTGVVMVVASWCLLGGAQAEAAKPKKAVVRSAGADSVVGAGDLSVFGVFRARLDVDARSKADGSAPSGQAEGLSTLAGVPISFGGRVTCVRVRGRNAVVKYAFDRAAPAALVGGGIEIFIRDGGVGNNDMMGFLPPQDPISWQLTGPTRCDDFDLAVFQTQTGDFAVTDR